MIKKYISILFLSLIISGISLFLGDIDLVFSEIFVKNTMSYDVFWNIRLPKLLSAFFACGALSIAGLLMQTYFLNPLAGPYVLGIHSGASLFVALFIIGGSVFPIFNNSLFYQLGVKGFSFLGSLFVLIGMLICSRFIKARAGVLIVGLLISYIAGSLLNMLVVFGNSEKIRTFLIWTMGSFERVVSSDLYFLISVSLISLLIVMFIAKDLNLLLTGENYAKSLGGNPERTKKIAIIITALLTSVVSSLCGPIAFVGMMIPHIARVSLKTSDHKILTLSTFALGGGIGVLADIFATKIFTNALPLNSILGVLGAPFLVYFFLRRKNL